MPIVSIILINYNTFQLTCNCIESIIQFTKVDDYEIILVDNNSTECDANLFLQKFSTVKLIKSAENGGFAKGNNLGIKQANGDFILLLNSDTYLIEDAISKTVNYYQQIKLNGIIGCKMLYPNGTLQHTARKFRTIKWELLDLFRFVLFILPYKKRAQLMLGKYFKSDFNLKCDWVNGAFFMFEKCILNELPDAQLDERFFMYGEDQLWCWQIKQLGYKVYFYANASIIHINNGSTEKKNRLTINKIMLKNEIKLMHIRLGKNFTYYILSFIYLVKENFRNFIKSIIFYSTNS